MRKYRGVQFWLGLLVILAGLFTEGRGEITWGGKAGFDFTGYGFTGSFHESNQGYSTRRSLSNHYLNASAAGSLVNPNFASFALRGRVLGAFSQSSTNRASNNFYLSPALDSYYGSVVMFPERRYPLRLYLGRQLDRELDYEDNNRTVSASVQPGLSVIRRYQRASTRRGAVLSLNMAENVSLVGQTGWSEVESIREYDFDEDRDIWVDVRQLLPDPLAETHRVEIVNKLPDASARVFIDGLDTIVAADQVIQLQIDSGRHQVLIVPVPTDRYNQFEFSVRVEGEQTWKIEHREPLSPRDQKFEEESSRVQLSMGQAGERSLTSFYDRTDRYDPATRQQTVRDQAAMMVEYPLSKSDKIKLETDYYANQSSRGGISGQSSQVFSHETSFEHSPRRGLAASALYEFSRGTTSTSGRELQTDLHRISSRVAMPFRKMDYRIELRTDVSLQSESAGSSTDQYDVELNNRLETRFLGMIWRPMNSSLITLRKRVRANGLVTNTTILDSKFNLDGTTARPTVLGDISLKADYGYRKQTDDLGFDLITLYGFDFLLSKKLMKGLHLDLLSIQKWESYGGTASELSGPNEHQATLALPTDHKQNYRIDLKVIPSENLAIGAGYSLVKERVSQIGQIIMNLNAVLPYLNTPLTSAMSHSNRDIGDLPGQTIFDITTELKYRYRQLQFTLEHTYSKEVLVAQTFSYFEIIAGISRSFGR